LALRSSSPVADRQWGIRYGRCRRMYRRQLIYTQNQRAFSLEFWRRLIGWFYDFWDVNNITIVSMDCSYNSCVTL
jgi:hypothetical protein